MRAGDVVLLEAVDPGGSTARATLVRRISVPEYEWWEVRFESGSQSVRPIIASDVVVGVPGLSGGEPAP